MLSNAVILLVSLICSINCSLLVRYDVQSLCQTSYVSEYDYFNWPLFVIFMATIRNFRLNLLLQMVFLERFYGLKAIQKLNF